MPIRITGMNSGLDTESIISELMSAQSTKKDNLVKAQTKLSYKQEAWKTLNSKVYNLYNKTLGDMKMSSTYTKKKTSVSDATKASIITGAGAVNGVQSLEVSKLAKTGYLTGAKLSSASSAATTLNTLDSGISSTTDAKFTIKVGSNTTEVALNGDSSISSVITKLKSAGVNANYDETNKRIFISAKETGDAADFTITASNAAGTTALTALGIPADGATLSGATRIEGADAKISLNGAEFTSSSNNFEINGITITALSETAVGEGVTLTTSDDTEGIYDIIKNFIKEYNTLINEMDTLYNAESADSYQPLTSEEKSEMSEDEIATWEKKIKTSILRNDSTLSEVAGTMKSAMQKGFEIDGETMYLSNFGIGTLGYFTSADNEKNAFHIDGNADDSSTSGNADKLKTAIANDPDKVISFFQKLADNMSTEIYSKMSSTKMRSIYKVYNDKQMASEYKDYTEKIEDQTEKLTEMENKYYKQFGAMETALAKLSSKQSALSGLLG